MVANFASKLATVTHSNPCPICGSKQSCAISGDKTTALCKNSNANKGDIVGSYRCVNTQNKNSHCTHTFIKIDANLTTTNKPPKTELPELCTEERNTYYRELINELRISEADKKHLIEVRGLTEEQIKEWQFRSVAPNHPIKGNYPQNLPGYRWDKKQLAISGRGILCPIYQIDQIVGCKVRLTNKRGDQRYTCVSDKNYTQYHIQGEQPLAVLTLAENYDSGVWVAEGNELKPAIIRLKYNIPVLGGARYWHSSKIQANKFLPEIKTKSNIINLCLDAGDIKNTNGISVKWYKEYKFFESQGFEVRFAWWGQASKEDNDIDELNNLENIEFINLDSFKELLKEHNPKAYQDIIDDESTLLNNVVSLDGYRKKPLVTFNQKAFNDLYEDQGYIVVDGQFYQWRGNYYQKIDNGLELQRCREYCNSYAVRKDDKEGQTTLSYPFTSTKYVNDLFKWSQIGLTVAPDKLDQNTGINCKNGVLTIKWEHNKPIVKLETHDPKKHFFTSEPIITYDPNADTKYADQLLRCLDEKQLQILIRNLGAALDIPTVRKHKGRLIKILFCIGQGSNGKDSIREVISLIFGREQVANFSLNDFTDYDSGNKNSLAGLSKARINWASESGKTTRIDNSLSLKRFATGDSLIERYLFKDGVEYVPNAIALFNLNELPNLFGTGQAALDRFAPLMFRKSFVKAEDFDPTNPNHELADPRFKYDREFLINEVCPAFLNYMIKGLQDLMIEGIDYSCTETALEQIQSSNNHLFDFISEAGWHEDPSAPPIRIGTLYEYLETWYLEEGILKKGGFDQKTWLDPVKPSDRYIKGANQLFARLKEIFPNIRKVETRPVGATKLVSFIEGISIELKTPKQLIVKSSTYSQLTPNLPPVYPQFTPSSLDGGKPANLDTVRVSGDALPPDTPDTPVFSKSSEFFAETSQTTLNNPPAADHYANKESSPHTGVSGGKEGAESLTTQGVEADQTGGKTGGNLGVKLGVRLGGDSDLWEQLDSLPVTDPIEEKRALFKEQQEQEQQELDRQIQATKHYLANKKYKSAFALIDGWGKVKAAISSFLNLPGNESLLMDYIDQRECLEELGIIVDF